jgi:hypothetical protein
VLSLAPARIRDRALVRHAAPLFVPLGSKAKNSAAQRRPVAAGYRLGPPGQNCRRIPAAPGYVGDVMPAGAVCDADDPGFPRAREWQSPYPGERFEGAWECLVEPIAGHFLLDLLNACGTRSYVRRAGRVFLN